MPEKNAWKLFVWISGAFCSIAVNAPNSWAVDLSVGVQATTRIIWRLLAMDLLASVIWELLKPALQGFCYAEVAQTAWISLEVSAEWLKWVMMNLAVVLTSLMSGWRSDILFLMRIRLGNGNYLCCILLLVKTWVRITGEPVTDLCCAHIDSLSQKTNRSVQG